MWPLTCLAKKNKHPKTFPKRWINQEKVITKRRKYGTTATLRRAGQKHDVFWSDRTKLEPFPKHHQKNTISTVRHGGGGIMLGGDALVRVEGIMNRSKYQLVLPKILRWRRISPSNETMSLNICPSQQTNSFTWRKFKFWNRPDLNPPEHQWGDPTRAAMASVWQIWSIFTKSGWVMLIDRLKKTESCD